jgi:hypothetical protein
MRAFARLIVVGLLGISFILASPLTVSSQGASNVHEWNTFGGSSNGNFVLNRPGFGAAYSDDGLDQMWDTLQGAVWVSYIDTVCPGCTDNGGSTFFPPLTPPAVYPSGVDFYNPSAGQYVSFFAEFDLDPTFHAVSGDLRLLGDDSIEVYLNGTLVGSFMEPTCNPPSQPCNFQLDGNGDPRIVPLSALYPALQPGTNLLRFDVTNLGSFNEGSNLDGTGGVSSFGLTYVLSLDVQPIPEPGTIALIGLGIAGLFFKRCRRPIC